MQTIYTCGDCYYFRPYKNTSFYYCIARPLEYYERDFITALTHKREVERQEKPYIVCRGYTACDKFKNDENRTDN